MPTPEATMSVDTSQQTAPPAVDTSLQAAPTAPVTEVAPVNNPSQQPTPPLQANAGETPAASPPGAERVDGGGVDIKSDEQSLSDYKAEKEAFLKGQPAPAGAQSSSAESSQVPAGQESTETAPGGDRLPKMPIRPADAQDQQLLAEWKQTGQGMPLREFIFQKMQPPAAATAKPADGETVAPVKLPDGSEAKTAFSSLDEIDAEIERLVNARYDALENFDTKAAREYERLEKSLMRQRFQFSAVEEVVQSVEETAFYNTWNESLGKARALFPEAGTPGTPLEAKAVEIRARWIEQGHPLAHSPDSAVALYAEAQASLAGQVSRPASAAPTVSTPPPSIHRPPGMVIAGGDARTNNTAGAPVEITPQNYAEMKNRLLRR